MKYQQFSLLVVGAKFTALVTVCSSIEKYGAVLPYTSGEVAPEPNLISVRVLTLLLHPLQIWLPPQNPVCFLAEKRI